MKEFHKSGGVYFEKEHLQRGGDSAKARMLNMYICQVHKDGDRKAQSIIDIASIT